MDGRVVAVSLTRTTPVSNRFGIRLLSVHAQNRRYAAASSSFGSSTIVRVLTTSTKRHAGGRPEDVVGD